MTLPQPTEQPTPRPAPQGRARTHRRTRRRTAQDFDERRSNSHSSFRQFARSRGVPRSSLQYQLRFAAPTDLPPQAVTFFRSAVGHDVLRRIVAAAFSTFHFHYPCGIRPIGEFLQLARLDPFVATSYGSLHSIASSLGEQLIDLGGGEDLRLAALMIPQMIPLVPDENFHSDKPTLVAIEPISNYILVETQRDHRDARTWTEVIKERLKGLPVTAVLMPSDQAAGLVKCAEEGLEIQHVSELFHGQQALLKPLLLPLQRPIEQAQKDLEKVKEALARFEANEKKRPLHEQQSISEDEFAYLKSLINEERAALERLQEARQQKETVLEAVRGIGDDYHPFDRQSGRPVEAEEMDKRLQERVESVAEVVEKAELGEKPHKAVSQARPWLLSLVAMVAWYWTLVRERVEELELSEAAEKRVYEHLLPGWYWAAAAHRARTPQERERLKEMSQRLLEAAWSAGGALAELPEEERKEVERLARECAGLFSRSSSCVEGRNGRLALHKHGQGKLSEKRLKVLTVVHNYLIKRADGTTAAERFFGNRPCDLFECLLERMPDLPKPAAKRPHAKGRKKAAQTTAKPG